MGVTLGDLVFSQCYEPVGVRWAPAHVRTLSYELRRATRPLAWAALTALTRMAASITSQHNSSMLF